MEEAEENPDRKIFLCNLSMVKALLQFLSVFDQKKVQDWLARLQAIEDEAEDAKLRNEYMAYLLIKVQKGILTQPFNKSPPAGELQPLSNVLFHIPGASILGDLVGLQRCRKTVAEFRPYSRTERILNANGDMYEKPNITCEPCRFHSDQPRPRKGVTASFAVFSNYDDN